jgi:hypothetical protein
MLMHKPRAISVSLPSDQRLPLVFAQMAVFAGDKPLSKKRPTVESAWIQGF